MGFPSSPSWPDLSNPRLITAFRVHRLSGRLQDSGVSISMGIRQPEALSPRGALATKRSPSTQGETAFLSWQALSRCSGQALTPAETDRLRPDLFPHRLVYIIYRVHRLQGELNGAIMVWVGGKGPFRLLNGIGGGNPMTGIETLQSVQYVTVNDKRLAVAGTTNGKP